MQADAIRLQYTWHCVVTGDVTILVHGFTSEDNDDDEPMHFTIQAHNLDSDAIARTTEGQTPCPCTTPPGSLPEQEHSTTDTAPSDGGDSHESPSPTDNQTTTFSETEVDTNTMISVGVPVSLVSLMAVVAVVVLIIAAVWLHRKCTGSKSAKHVEEGRRKISHNGDDSRTEDSFTS